MYTLHFIHAEHPKPLPHHLGHHSAIADENGHLPQGLDAGHEGIYPAKQHWDDLQYLQTSGGHGEVEEQRESTKIWSSWLSLFFSFNIYFYLFIFSSTSLLLPTHLPPPSCTHAQSCNPMDGSLPGSSVRGLFQARILEWVAISFSLFLFVYLFGLPWWHQ